MAVAAAAQYLGARWNDMNTVPVEERSKIFQGRVEIALFEAGIGDNASKAYSESAHLIADEFRAQAAVAADAVRAAHDKLIALSDDLEHKHQARQAAIKSEWDAFSAHAKNEHSEALSSIAATEAAYKEQMSLRSSVTYWTTKAGEHEHRAGYQKWWLIGYAAVASAITALAIWKIFEQVVHLSHQLEGKGATALLVLAGAAVLIASTVVWIARLMVRVYFSERQLGIDARERATMAQTYVALTNEKLASDADRAIVLTSLFKPSAAASGGAEDGPDTLYHALLAKVLDAKVGDGKK